MVQESKAKKITYWVLTLWLALGMISTGVVQLMKAKTGAGGADNVARLGYPLYILTIIGVWKILGVIAVLTPKFPLLKEWAYAGFFFLMSGAVISHLMAGSPPGETLPAVLLLVLTVISWYFRPADRKIISVGA
ncbi:DoxX family protein [Mucilaginibacter sp. L3T2-6]|uniref:DoxX family protein n=1 Tax=Mucilaginibacter sp. L3T2-6 TaxID=3062491 RepID=UPI00267736F4|nr:DoxX family protein [Mucilaginibacter sp. L3T2-6]MDO3643204.1 DoxX family protein [Mucilaginibacter sp. L3T2-6]MDV6215528.1 DoxX family protein [Mucilaginibacter sp. L3T2-6]